MSDYIYIGDIVNTHGIKGELRLLSDFEYKNQVFKKGFNIYIGSNKEHEVINSYRHHKIFDMITLDGYSNINDVLKYKSLKVYVKRTDLSLPNGYVYKDLIGFNIVENAETLGKVVNIMYNKNNVLIEVLGKKKFYIPFVNNFILNVSLDTKTINTKNAKDLIL